MEPFYLIVNKRWKSMTQKIKQEVYGRSKKENFLNTYYTPIISTKDASTIRDPNDVEDWIQPDLNNVKWWWQLYGRKDNEMNIVPDDTFKKWTSNKEPSRNFIQDEKDHVDTNYSLLNQTKDLLSSFNILGRK